MTVDHKAMREAIQKATPGPWKYSALINGYGVTSAGVYFEQVAFVAENSGVKKDREQAKNNAIVIANAIVWLRQLLDESEKWEKEARLQYRLFNEQIDQNRQLLDENQNKDAIIEHLQQEVEIHAKELSKAVDENQALTKERDFYKEDRDRCERLERKAHEQIEAQAKEIERLEIALHTYKSCDKSAVDLYYEMQEQAKEIEQLKIERDNLKASIEGCKGIEDYYRIQCRLRECQADKAAAVEALRKAERFISKIMEFHGQNLSVFNWHQNGDAEPWDNFFDENMDGDELEVIQATLQRIESGDKND